MQSTIETGAVALKEFRTTFKERFTWGRIGLLIALAPMLFFLAGFLANSLKFGGVLSWEYEYQAIWRNTAFAAILYLCVALFSKRLGFGRKLLCYAAGLVLYLVTLGILISTGHALSIVGITYYTVVDSIALLVGLIAQIRLQSFLNKDLP